MAKQPNKIELNLAGDQVKAFCEALYASKDRTLKTVQRMAFEYGVEVSLMSAKTFRDSTYKAYLKRLNEINTKIESAAAIVKAGAAANINEVTSALVASELHDFVNNILDEDGELDFSELSKVLQRLRTGDQRQQLLEARLKEYEAKEEEREAKRKELRERAKRVAKGGKGGMSEEARALLKEAIGLS